MNDKGFTKKPKGEKYKPANIFVKPEDVIKGETYAFNYNPIYQPVMGKLNSLRDWYMTHDMLFSKTCIGSTYKLYVEISATGRFHFHGYIKVIDIVKFYAYDVHTLIVLGTAVMKSIGMGETLNHQDEKDKWDNYVLKQQHFMQDFLHQEIYGPLVKPRGLICIKTAGATISQDK